MSDPLPHQPQPHLTGLPPSFDADTRLLLLGSFPSQASLAAAQYYAHPRNLFWPLMSAVLELDLASLAYPQRLAALRARGIGVWDVWASCQRVGSLDSAIRQPVPNDIAGLLACCPQLRALACNGAAAVHAARVWRGSVQHCELLPSSSPANAAQRWDAKLAVWRRVIAAHALPAAVGADTLRG